MSEIAKPVREGMRNVTKSLPARYHIPILLIRCMYFSCAVGFHHLHQLPGLVKIICHDSEKSSVQARGGGMAHVISVGLPAFSG